MVSLKGWLLILLGIIVQLCGILAEDKRLLLHSEMDLAQEIMNLKSSLANLTSENINLRAEVSDLKSKVTTLEQSNGIQDKPGGIYIRWGRNTCPVDAEIVYKGYIAGKHHTSTGSGTNHLCLPDDPTWAHYDNVTTNYRGTLFGTEINIPEPNPIFEYAVNNQDLPCSVCKSKRMALLMTPARKDCYPGWTMEYWGYLMTSSYDMKTASTHICLDSKPDFNVHGASNDDEHMIYPVEGRCGSLPCPPYVNGRELACTVCSK